MLRKLSIKARVTLIDT